jgi:hypothetical protein
MKIGNSKLMNLSVFARIPNILFSFFLILFAAGCSTVNSTDASKFAATATTVKSQADSALASAADLTRTQAIIYVAAQPRLTEDEFSETPSVDVIEGWDNVLSAIEAYAVNLAALSSPNATKSFDASATNLFEQMTLTTKKLHSNSLSSSPEVTAGLAAAFTETADLILEAESQATARKIAMATDPKITKILNLLAAEIGDDHSRTNPCLRTTIYRAWNVERDALTAQYLTANNLGAKEDIARQFEALLARRDAEDEALASLRNSLLALAAAHHGLAQGDSASIETALTMSTAELQRTQALFNQFNTDLKTQH